MNRDHVAGGFRHLKGRGQSVAGSVTGDLGRQAEGALNQVAGGARYLYGDARDAYRDVRALTQDTYEDVRARARTGMARGSDLADEAAKRGRAMRRQASGTLEGNRTLGLLVAAGVGFALASLGVKRSS